MDILKLKNKMSKLKTSLDGLDNITFKNEQSLRDLWETPKALLLMYHQISGRDKKDHGAKKLFEIIFVKNILNLEKGIIFI